jgi:hypothetical protein
LLVDGKPVEIEEVAQLIPAPFDVSTQVQPPAQPKRKRVRKVKDEDFLRECGIANTLEGETEE